jgi:hypothetical protein
MGITISQLAVAIKGGKPTICVCIVLTVFMEE